MSKSTPSAAAASRQARGKRLGIEHQPVHVEDHRRGSADGPR